MKNPPLNWYIERIGKIVYRNKTTCKCLTCKRVYENGIIISDEMHADYLDMSVNSYNQDGIPLKYFDTEEERDLFELTLI